MIVSDVMTRELLTAAGHLTVTQALRLARERDVHHVLVVEDKRLRGVVCVCELRDRGGETPLRDCITSQPAVIWAQCSLRQAARIFVEKNVSCFPVCDGEQLVGVITRGDLRRSVITEELLPGFRCKFCGSTRHVRALRGDSSLPACLDCTDRVAPSAGGLFEEGVKG